MIHTEVSMAGGQVYINFVLPHGGIKKHQLHSMQEAIEDMLTCKFLGEKASSINSDRIKAVADRVAPILWLLALLDVNI